MNQQFCRWLLLSLDRLQKLGVIKYSRGEITVLDRPRLEQLFCERYALVKAETDRVLRAGPLHRATER